MRKFNGYEPKKASGGRELLPAGGYIAKILNAEEVQYDWGNVVVISFDILEGEHKGFFAKDYRAQTQEDKKWRGTYRLREPNDDGTEQDCWKKNAFNNAVWSLQESNPGYHFDWDEGKFKGKLVGVLFRNREWEMDDGRTGWTTECCALTDVASIQNNTYKMPKDKPLAKKAAAAPAFPPVEEDEGDLPF